MKRKSDHQGREQGWKVSRVMGVAMAGWIGSLAVVSGQQGGTVLKDEKAGLEVELDREFPRVKGYRFGGREMRVEDEKIRVVELNGKASECKVRYQELGKKRGEYEMEFPNEQVKVRMRVEVDGAVMSMKIEGLEENGSVKVKTLGIPRNAMVAMPASAILATATMDAEYNWPAKAVDWMPGGRLKQIQEHQVGEVGKRKPGHATATYGFLSDDQVAVAVASGNYSARQRVGYEVGGEGCRMQHPLWEVRTYDEDSPNLSWVKVIWASDLNGDGKATWQDAAVAYRRAVPKPLGYEVVKDCVHENISMNFASSAQQPFLKTLDEIKRVSLHTDGLGGLVILKGFSSEGHDSANTDYTGHWNERAGGLKDLRTLMAEAKAYQTRVGIHINTSEFYPEAHRYDPKLLDRNEDGKVRVGWVWLDEGYMIDHHKDFREGTVVQALKDMGKELPDLGFVYVDTFWNNGWPAKRLAETLHGCQIPFGTEGSAALDPWSIWSHARCKNEVARFLWFSERDVFDDDVLLRGGRSDADGFMGWQSRHDYGDAIQRTFTHRLPAKYLQHFELLKWEPGKVAEFAGGLKVEREKERVVVRKDGRELMDWDANLAQAKEDIRYGLPWPPQGVVEKCYLWNGRDEEWEREVPEAWSQKKRLYLSKLTPEGRVDEREVAVKGGKVQLHLAKSTPYILDSKPTGKAREMDWGRGTMIKDPGFNSYGLKSWQVSDAKAVSVVADGQENPRLVIKGKEAVSVKQEIKGLEGGQWYRGAVWARTGKGRKASLEIRVGNKVFSNYTDQDSVMHKGPNDPRNQKPYQQVQVLFQMPQDGGVAELRLAVEAGEEAEIEFDEVRLVRTAVSAEAAKHDFWEDFEHVDLGGYGPFTCCAGERTHLSESNPPYTKDTIHGKFSLKSRDTGRVLRTIPTRMRFKPNTLYRVKCLALGKGRLSAYAGVDAKESALAEWAFSTGGDGGVGQIEGEFRTGAGGDAYLALYRDGGDAIVLDDLAVDEVR